MEASLVLGTKPAERCPGSCNGSCSSLFPSTTNRKGGNPFAPVHQILNATQTSSKHQKADTNKSLTPWSMLMSSCCSRCTTILHWAPSKVCRSISLGCNCQQRSIQEQKHLLEVCISRMSRSSQNFFSHCDQDDSHHLSHWTDLWRVSLVYKRCESLTRCIPSDCLCASRRGENRKLCTWTRSIEEWPEKALTK